MKDCIFCKFVKKEKKCPMIYEDEHTFVFLDHNPATEQGGHTLVLPKNHYELLTDIPDDELAKVVTTIKKVSKALLGFADGVNVLQNNKKAAGQWVKHVHFHIIPRFKDDGIQIEVWKPHKYKDGQIEEMIKKIQNFLKD